MINSFSLQSSWGVNWSGHVPMVPIEVVIGEVRIEQSHLVDSRQHSVEFSRFVHDFMSYCKLWSCQIWGYEDYSEQCKDIAPFKFKGHHSVQQFEVDWPIEYDGSIKGHSIPYIVFLQLSPFRFVWVAFVQTEDFVEKGEGGIDNGYERKWVGFVEKETGCCEKSQNVVGKGCLHKTVLAEDVDLPPGENLLKMT